jgi:tape measure domain-containing protein
MSNLGIGAKESQKSIEKMSDKLAGLPTTLDQGAMAVQRFTSANGNVKKSTDIFLALNNAILAGGASSEIQSSALEQLSQAYAKGKPDMMEWRTAMTAMPAQLKQVATAMGYVDADSLGEALRNGKVSMDDFMETVTKLNTKGVNGFQSFEKQARNSTGGIGTSIQVAKTQVVKGVADVITSLNKGLQDANLPSISEIIATIGKKAKEVLDGIAKNMPKIIQTLKTILPILIPIFAAITAFKIVLIIKGVIAALSDLFAVISANPVGLIVAAIAGLVAAFIILWNKSEAFRNFWKGLWEGIKSVFSLVIDWFNAKIQYWINIFRGVINFITGVFTGNWKQAFNGLKQVASAFINSFLNSFGGLPRRMLSVGINVVRGIWSGISGSLSWIKNKISGWVGNVLNFIKKLFGIHSPSTVMRDEVGKYLAQGMGVGFDNELDNVYRDMQKAIDIENGKMQANVQTGKVFNTLTSTTPVHIDLDASVEMDSQKVGRLVTPSVTKTIKNGGGI